MSSSSAFSSIGLYPKTKKVNTYGKRGFNIVPVNDYDEFRRGSDSSSSSSSQPQALLLQQKQTTTESTQTQASIRKPNSSSKAVSSTRTKTKTRTSISSVPPPSTPPLKPLKRKPLMQKSTNENIRRPLSEINNTPNRTSIPNTKKLSIDNDQLTKKSSSKSLLSKTSKSSCAATSLATTTTKKAPTTTTSTTDKKSKSFKQLLQNVSQSEPFDFAQYIESFSLENNFKSTQPWSKIGEATYSEVFSTTLSNENQHAKQVVFKIIPLNDKKHNIKLNQSNSSSSPETSSPTSVLRELDITRTLGQLDGFVKLLSASVVKGKYPAPLLNEWDEWKKSNEKGCENIRPDNFDENQTFAIICLPFTGTDLDHYSVRSWAEALFIFTQVVKAVADAESSFDFEHRDLHCGNILIQQPEKNLVDRLERLSLHNPSKAAPIDTFPETTIIDFSISRITINNESVFTDLSLDDSFFQGKGDYQYDLYRIMRTATDHEWSSFHPETNVAWLHFLSHKLTKRDSSGACKKLRIPPSIEEQAIKAKARVSTTSTNSSREKRKIAEHERKCYERLSEIESKLAAAVGSLKGERRRGRASVNLTSASQVLELIQSF